MSHPEDDDLHKAGLPIPFEGTPVDPNALQSGPQPLAAKAFTAGELEQLSDEVPCLFYVSGTRSHHREGVLPRGIVGVLAGAAGAGKSFFALEMMLAAANGGALFGVAHPGIPYVQPSDAGSVLYLSLEDSREIVGRRLRDIAHARDFGVEKLARIHVVAWNELDLDRALFRHELGAHNTDLYARATATLQQSGPWSLIVVDTFARSAFGDVEANPEAATAFIQRLESWTKLPGNPTVLIIHHSRKAEASDKVGKWLSEALSAEAARGTGAIVGAARWLGMLAKPKHEASGDVPHRNVFFEIAKANGVADDAMPRLHMVPGPRGVLRIATDEERAAVQHMLKGGAAVAARPKPNGAVHATVVDREPHDWSRDT